MNQVKKVQRYGSQVSILFENADEAILFDSIRGGLTWPSAAMPGCLCLLAQKPEMNRAMKKPLVLIEEFSTEIPDALFEKVAESFRKTFCWQFYPEHLNDKNRDFWNEFEDFTDLNNLSSRIELLNPEITNWLSGIHTIRAWIDSGSLTIPGSSILAGELGKIVLDDQRDVQRASFPAISALVNVLGSFVKPEVHTGGNVPPGKYHYA